MSGPRLATPIFYSAVILEAVVLCGLVASTRDCRIAISRHVLLYIAAALPFALALIAASRAQLPGLWGVLLLSMAMRGIAFAGPVLLSDDIYRYVWDGRVSLAGVDPYAHPPSDDALSSLRDENWARINHPTMRTIYPAGAQMLFAGLAWLAPHPNGFRAAMGLFDVLVVALIFALALGPFDSTLSSEQRRGHAARAALAYGLCPLACVESTMSGHLDSAALAGLLSALALLRTKRIAGFAVGLLLGLGAAIKLAPTLVLPFFARRRWTAALGFALGVTIFFAPFVRSGLDAFETLDAFARRWEGNAGPFALVKLALEKTITALAGASSSAQMVHLRSLDELALAVQGTFFSLHKDGPMDPQRPGAFPVTDLALAGTKALGALALLSTCIAAWRRRGGPLDQAYLVLAALVLVSPVLHPWYALWVLPLAAVRGVWPWFAFAAVLPLGYLPLFSWWTRGAWREPTWSMVAQTGTLLVAFGIWGYQRFRKSKKSSNRL
ncbi:MAG: glycosyltransferase 87 family protein [Myxococcota bacterium]|nr:glycosyltransferase 87 family protein [Myxococcota bacterium]